MDGASAVSQQPRNPSLQVPDSPSAASPSSTCALARFEFEAGRGNEGTKILLVEWDPTAVEGLAPSQHGPDGWKVTWDGQKPDGFKKIDGSAAGEKDDDSTIQRAYFLIYGNCNVPPAVVIKHNTGGPTLSAKCMPAIFAPELGLGTADAGKRGVLHTIWAKKRLAQLEDELQKEGSDNVEGVGLAIIDQERQFVLEHFGLGTLGPATKAPPQQPHSQQRPQAPPPLQPVSRSATIAPALQSPKTPGGGRLAEKLKGLKLTTSASEASSSNNNPTVPVTTAETPYQALSPLAAMNAPKFPPPAPAAAGMGSLDAIMGGSGTNASQSPPRPAAVKPETKETEDELFALPMSPRSPEMKTSPFSFLK